MSSLFCLKVHLFTKSQTQFNMNKQAAHLLTFSEFD